MEKIGTKYDIDCAVDAVYIPSINGANGREYSYHFASSYKECSQTYGSTHARSKEIPSLDVYHTSSIRESWRNNVSREFSKGQERKHHHLVKGRSLLNSLRFYFLR